MNFKSLSLALAFYCVSTHLTAQLTITPTIDPQILAQEIAGKGVIVSNVQFTGANGSAGTFTNASSKLGISKGILLTSGRAKTSSNGIGVDRPATAFASNPMNFGGDTDLSFYSGQTTRDACVLEFDFIPQGDSIKVNFVFGSEEYPQFNCSNFNDAFAFLITGQNYPTPTNIALVPETTIPVSINSINNGIASNIGICQALGNGAPFTNLYVNNIGDANITYNGYTVVLTAKAEVIPCQTYHIKLAIADAFDDAYDSGVFIEAASFSSPAIQLSGSGFTDDQGNILVIEGCNSGKFKLSRPASEAQKPATVTLQYQGTATSGIDYLALPTTVNFLAGETAKEFDVIPLEDLLKEDIESIKIYRTSGVCGTNFIDSLSFLITDTFYVRNVSSDIYCSAIPKTLTAPKIDNNPINDYLWSTGATTQVININAGGTYWVQHHFNDKCFSVDTFQITNGDPTVNIGPDIIFCDKDSVQLNAQNAGNSILWNTGQTTQTIYAKTNGQYLVTVTTQDGCFISDTLLATVKPLPQIELGNDTALCSYESLLLDASFPNTFYQWNNGSTAPSITISNPGKYSVIADLDGCIVEDSILVTQKVAALAIATTLDPEIVEGSIARLFAKLDNANAQYQWSPAEYLNNANISNPLATPIQSITYHLLTSSVDGCIAEDTIHIKVIPELKIPNVFSPNGDGINDTWNIPFSNLYTKAELQIFNRFGQLIFKLTGFNKPWDGTYQGNLLPVGTYYYIINPNVSGGKTKAGSVTILR